jgi:PhzF family phenazine biosynthesis protein
MSINKFYQVDAFTDKIFQGNPAAVILPEEKPDFQIMQNIAMEMNLSETAFCYPVSEGLELKWFTPATEIKLCGHATLATTWVLFREGKIRENTPVHFNTLSGILKCWVVSNDIYMNFPVIETFPTHSDIIAQKLGIPVLSAAENKDGYLIIEVSHENIENYKPDPQKILELGNYLVILTGQSCEKQYDIVSRVFAPAFGITEDPVTGSAHCALAHFWNQKLKKTQLSAKQVSARTGIIETSLTGNRVILQGKAVIAAEGKLYL